MNERLQKAQARHEELVADFIEKQNTNKELQIRQLTIDNEHERKHLDRIDKYWWYRIVTDPLFFVVLTMSLAWLAT